MMTNLPRFGLLVAELSTQYQTVESAEFQRQAPVVAADLPRRIRAELGGYARAEDDSVVVLPGLRIDDGAIGPTPYDRRVTPVPSPTLAYDSAFYLIATDLRKSRSHRIGPESRVIY